MEALHTQTPVNARLASLVSELQHVVDTRDVPADIAEQAAAALGRYRGIDDVLTDDQRRGTLEHYTRHILYADPAERFTLVSLVWHPGQFTPVHGHHTWCAYAILSGSMSEERYRWDATRELAVHTDNVRRGECNSVWGQAGLEAIHRLRNVSEEVAVSLHVYGVPVGRVTTHVNRVLKTA